MEKTQTVNDLKRYIALNFITDIIGKGSKDVIVCTAKNNLSINIQPDNTKINSIFNECIVIYYSPMINVDDATNDDNKNEESSTNLITMKILNKSAINMDFSVSFPFD